MSSTKAHTHKRALSSNSSALGTLDDDRRRPFATTPSAASNYRLKNSKPRLQESSAPSSRCSSHTNNNNTANLFAKGAYTYNNHHTRNNSASSYSLVVDSDYSGSDFLVVPPNGNENTVSHDRRMSNEELIDIMEKEQDAMVIRFMREISSLKEENRSLRLLLSSGGATSTPPTTTSSCSSCSTRHSTGNIMLSRLNTNYVVEDLSHPCSKRPSLLVTKNANPLTGSSTVQESKILVPRSLDVARSK